MDGHCLLELGYFPPSLKDLNECVSGRKQMYDHFTQTGFLLQMLYFLIKADSKVRVAFLSVFHEQEILNDTTNSRLKMLVWSPRM